MTTEESLQKHEQWLLSIDGNLDRVTADLSQTSQGLAALVGIVERLAAQQENQAARAAQLDASVDQLARLVEDYIRFRGNGSQQN